MINSAYMSRMCPARCLSHHSRCQTLHNTGCCLAINGPGTAVARSACWEWASSMSCPKSKSSWSLKSETLWPPNHDFATKIESRKFTELFRTCCTMNLTVEVFLLSIRTKSHWFLGHRRCFLFFLLFFLRWLLLLLLLLVLLLLWWWCDYTLFPQWPPLLDELANVLWCRSLVPARMQKPHTSGLSA